PYLPDSALERAQVVQWLFFEQEHVMSGIGGARFRILTGRHRELVPARLELARTALGLLAARLGEREHPARAGCPIAGVSDFAYGHVARDAGFELGDYPAVAAWVGRIEELPRFMDDFVRYPENATPGRSRSVYDA